MKARSDDEYSEKETVERREAARKRMLATPHQPHQPIGKKKKSPVNAQEERSTILAMPIAISAMHKRVLSLLRLTHASDNRI
jgi:hypothetical protein